MSFLTSNSLKKFHGKFKERAAKKKRKKEHKHKRVAVAYALLGSVKESCQRTRKIIMVFG